MALAILHGPALRERTTLRLGGTAMAEVVLGTAEDCEALPDALKRLGGRPLILGYGSNILAADGQLPLVVVTPAMQEAPTVVGEDARGVLVHVGAGFRLPRLLGWLCSHGLSGLEGLAGIPGTVGGAVAMNAGSYGCETGERIDRVTLFDPQHGVRTLERRGLQFSYRHFGVLADAGGEEAPEYAIVTGAVFRVGVASRDVVHGKMQECYRKKKATQPVTSYSAGCVFKNPAHNLSAGKILDDNGFKGKRHGDMMFSEMHANFLINRGNGTSEQAEYLIQNAQETIHRITDLSLELEVKIIK